MKKIDLLIDDEIDRSNYFHIQINSMELFNICKEARNLTPWWNNNHRQYANSFITPPSIPWIFSLQEIEYIKHTVNKYNHNLQFNEKFNELLK